MTSQARVLRWLPLALVIALPSLASVLGARGALRLPVNLGPGDAPYVSGFAPDYEVDDRVGTHWTTYDATIALPLVVSGPATLSYRFARVLPQTAVVKVTLDGRPVDRFTCRGGRFKVRIASAGVLDRSAGTVRFEVDSHDRTGRGLKLDWIRLEMGAGAVVRLVGSARWGAPLFVLLIGTILCGLGWSPGRAALLALPFGLAATAGLLWDPWTTCRLLRGMAPALALAGVVGIFAGRLLLARGSVAPETLRAAGALATLAFAARALAVNVPDFYYPDLRTHARLVQVLQTAGLDFFAHPAKYIWEHGVWRLEALGGTYAFPYTPAFHIPFAFLGLGYDDLITALKLGGVAMSVVPLLLVWAMAARLGLSPIAAVLMLAIPTYTSRLSYAFLPALFGHAVDMAFLYWLSGHSERLGERRVWLAGVALVSACQLAYISGVLNVCVFVAVFGVTQIVEGPRPAWRRGLAVLAMGVAASGVSVLVYYRDFIPMLADVALRFAASGTRVPSHYPVQGWLTVVYARSRDFFGIGYPILAVGGFVMAFRRRISRSLLVAWIATYLILLLGRARVPDVFLHGHETLFVTPLVCLMAAESLQSLHDAGGLRRLMAWGLLAGLAVQGVAIQYVAVVEQTANAL